MAGIKQHIADICEAAGPRPAGSEAEHRGAEIIARKLRARGAEVDTEEFAVRPRALQLLLLCSCAGYLAAYGLFWFSPMVSLAVLVATLSQTAARLLAGRCLWDLFIAKKTSSNVIGKLRPAGTTRQVLIFAGHHDSAFHMPLLARSTFRVVPIMVLVLVLSSLALAAFDAWITLGSLMQWDVDGGLSQTVILGFCGVGAVYAVVLPVGMLRSETVMGANDNLSAVAVSLAVAKEAGDLDLQHTELRFISFGSEEVGLVGSRAFVQRHLEDLAGSILINLESFGQQGSLRVITGELMAPTRHSSEVIQLAHDAAKEAGISLEPHFLPGGLTDAASFSRKGLDAATLIRLDKQNYLDHYHTPGDDLPAIRDEGLQEAFELCLQIVKQVEAGVASEAK